MRKIFLFLMLIIFLMTGCGGGDPVKENNGNSKTLDKIVIGVDDEFPPICFHNERNDGLVGFDIDLAKEAAKRLGVKVEFKPIDWNNKEKEITSGNIDIIWNGCDITEEYKNYMIFSKPYMENRQILLVKKGNPKNIHAVGDLEGKIIATQAGSNSETYIAEDKALRNSFADFRTYRNVKEGFELLNKEEVDVLIIDEIAGRYEKTIHPDMCETIEDTVGPITEFGIGFRKEDTELRDKVQTVFDEMVKDGTAKKISLKWFHADLIKSRR